MKDHPLTLSSLGYFVKLVTELLTSNQTKKYRVNIVEWREKRSLSLNAFQHAIYGDISKFLIKHGRKDWTPAVTKKNMKNKFLGWVDEEFIDVVTGEVTTNRVLVSTADLDVGDSCDYTTKLLAWCVDMGIEIRIPSKCDYTDLMNKQNN